MTATLHGAPFQQFIPVPGVFGAGAADARVGGHHGADRVGVKPHLTAVGPAHGPGRQRSDGLSATKTMEAVAVASFRVRNPPSAKATGNPGTGGDEELVGTMKPEKGQPVPGNLPRGFTYAIEVNEESLGMIET